MSSHRELRRRLLVKSPSLWSTWLGRPSDAACRASTVGVQFNLQLRCGADTRLGTQHLQRYPTLLTLVPRRNRAPGQRHGRPAYRLSTAIHGHVLGVDSKRHPDAPERQCVVGALIGALILSWRSSLRWWPVLRHRVEPQPGPIGHGVDRGWTLGQHSGAGIATVALTVGGPPQWTSTTCTIGVHARRWDHRANRSSQAWRWACLLVPSPRWDGCWPLRRWPGSSLHCVLRLPVLSQVCKESAPILVVVAALSTMAALWSPSSSPAPLPCCRPFISCSPLPSSAAHWGASSVPGCHRPNCIWAWIDPDVVPGADAAAHIFTHQRHRHPGVPVQRRWRPGAGRLHRPGQSRTPPDGGRHAWTAGLQHWQWLPCWLTTAPSSVAFAG